MHARPAGLQPSQLVATTRPPRPGTRRRDPEGDRAKLSSAGVDVLFEPTTLYEDPASGAPPHETFVTVEALQLPLCGAARTTHFRGVATVVTKLFNIVAPALAVFGRKDYQQLKVLTRMARCLTARPPLRRRSAPTEPSAGRVCRFGIWTCRSESSARLCCERRMAWP